MQWISGATARAHNSSRKCMSPVCWRGGMLFAISAVLLTLGYLYTTRPRVRHMADATLPYHVVVSDNDPVNMESDWQPAERSDVISASVSRLVGQEDPTDPTTCLLKDAAARTDAQTRQEEGIGVTSQFAVPVQRGKIVNLLRVEPPEYLMNYKNPCWLERLRVADPYKRNAYADILSNSVLRKFEILRKRWHRRLRNGRARRLRCLPFFYLAGMPKCGTTDLYVRMNLHPQITPGLTKEPHWWARRRLGFRSRDLAPIPLRDYVDLYDLTSECIRGQAVQRGRKKPPFHNMIFGDGSASTMWDNDFWQDLPENHGFSEPRYIVPHYLFHLTPQARILVMLRDPTDRLYSDYLYFQPANKSALDFHERVISAIPLMQHCFRVMSPRACVYDLALNRHNISVRLRLGLYHIFLRDWLKVFPREQIHVVRLEDYAANQTIELQQIFNFLGLDYLSRAEMKAIFGHPRKNVRHKEDREIGPMFPETRDILDRYYRPFNLKLAELLGDKRFTWEDRQDDSRRWELT